MTGLDGRWCRHSKCCVCTKEKFCGQIVRGYDFVLVSEDELKYRWKNRIDDHRSLMELASMQDAMRYYKERETKEKECMENKEIKGLENNYAYKKGLEEAWEITRKLALNPRDGGYNVGEVDSIFGSRWYDVLLEMSIHEVKEKIAAYEAEQAKPKLGDIVKFVHKSNGITTYTGIYSGSDDDFHWLLIPDHKTPSKFPSCVWTIEKTGKYFDIQSMLDEIG